MHQILGVTKLILEQYGFSSDEIRFINYQGEYWRIGFKTFNGKSYSVRSSEKEIIISGSQANHEKDMVIPPIDVADPNSDLSLPARIIIKMYLAYLAKFAIKKFIDSLTEEDVPTIICEMMAEVEDEQVQKIISHIKAREKDILTIKNSSYALPKADK